MYVAVLQQLGMLTALVLLGKDRTCNERVASYISLDTAREEKVLRPPPLYHYLEAKYVSVCVPGSSLALCLVSIHLLLLQCFLSKSYGSISKIIQN